MQHLGHALRCAVAVSEPAKPPLALGLPLRLALAVANQYDVRWLWYKLRHRVVSAVPTLEARLWTLLDLWTSPGNFGLLIKGMDPVN